MLFVNGGNARPPILRQNTGGTTVADKCVALERRRRFRRIPGTPWFWQVYEIRISFEVQAPAYEGTFTLTRV